MIIYITHKNICTVMKKQCSRKEKIKKESKNKKDKKTKRIKLYRCGKLKQKKDRSTEE